MHAAPGCTPLSPSLLFPSCLPDGFAPSGNSSCLVPSARTTSRTTLAIRTTAATTTAADAPHPLRGTPMPTGHTVTRALACGRRTMISLPHLRSALAAHRSLRRCHRWWPTSQSLPPMTRRLIPATWTTSTINSSNSTKQARLASGPPGCV